jgi:hypothetical protein
MRKCVYTGRTMIDFQITQEEFAKAARQMTRARTASPNEVVDLTCYPGSVRFLVTGREYTATALVQAKGLAQLPLNLLPKLRKVAGTFNEKPLRIRIENGKIRMNSMSLASGEITEKKINDRAIDIPDDAPVADILALHSPDAGLLRTVLEKPATPWVHAFRATCGKPCQEGRVPAKAPSQTFQDTYSPKLSGILTLLNLLY